MNRRLISRTVVACAATGGLLAAGPVAQASADEPGTLGQDAQVVIPYEAIGSFKAGGTTEWIYANDTHVNSHSVTTYVWWGPGPGQQDKITDPVPDPDVFYGKPIDVPEGTRVGIKVCVDNTGLCSGWGYGVA